LGSAAAPHHVPRRVGQSHPRARPDFPLQCMLVLEDCRSRCLSGTAMGSPNNWGKPIFRKIIKTQTNSQIVNCIPRNHGLVTGAHGPGTPGRPIKWSAPAPLGPNSASLGAQRRTTETPPRSRAGRPLERNSATLEGWMPPRVGHRLARGPRGSASPAPTPTGALNALTQCGHLGQRRIPTTPAH
jgi:hypothetical protein